MKYTKYLFLNASLFENTSIEEKLTRLTAEGWHLEKAGTFLWKFTRGAPMLGRYWVTCVEGDFSQTGWELVASHGQCSIYRNADRNAVLPQTDHAETLQSIRKSMNRSFFPVSILLTLLFLVQFFLHLGTAIRHPSYAFSSELMLATLACTLGLALSHGIGSLYALWWLRRAQRAADRGIPLPESRFRIFCWADRVLLAVYVLLFLLWRISLRNLMPILLIAALCLLAVLYWMPKLSRWLISVGTTSLCALIMALLIPWMVAQIDDSMSIEGLFTENSAPVTLAQLTGYPGDHQRSKEHHTFLSSYYAYNESIDGSTMSYTIVDVNCPLLYDAMLHEQKQEFLRYADGEPEELLRNDGLAELFGAEYVLNFNTQVGMNLTDHLFICWNDRIVQFYIDPELTQEQLELLKEVLMPQ